MLNTSRIKKILKCLNCGNIICNTFYFMTVGKKHIANLKCYKCGKVGAWEALEQNKGEVVTK